MAAKNNKSTKSATPRDYAKGKGIVKNRRTHAPPCSQLTHKQDQDSETCSNFDEIQSEEWSPVGQQMQLIDLYQCGHEPTLWESLLSAYN